MFEEVAAIGASGAKKYIKHLENEIKHLEGTKEKYNEEVENIYNHIQEKQNKIDELAANIAHLEQQNYELLEKIETKEKQLNEYDTVNDKLYEENETLLKLIETNKFHADSLRTLYNDEQDKYKKTIEELHIKENQLKKLDKNIFLKNTEIDKLMEMIDQLKKEKSEAEQKAEYEKKEEIKKRTTAERNLRISEIGRMTLPAIKEILINQYGYDFSKKPYVKVADVKKILKDEEGLL